MATRLAYQYLSEIDYDKLEFNPDDPDPMPDAMYQYPVLEEIFQVLRAHLAGMGPPEDIFRGSNTFICYDRRDPNVRVGPDLYIAFGVDAKAIEDRKMYLPWEAGKPPDFVLEVASESTARQDIINKRRIYAEIGVPEYWRFDRSGGEYYGQALSGERLVGGSYEQMELTTEPDGILKGYSPVLGLSLAWRDGLLRFYNPQTGTYLPNLEELTAALSTEQSARQQAEARIAQLEAELRRRQAGS